MPRQPPPPVQPAPVVPWYKGIVAIVFFAAISVLAIVIVAVFLLRGHGANAGDLAKTPSEIVVEDPDHVLTGAILDLGLFTVNLGAENLFVVTKIQIEFYDFSPPETMSAKLPEFRDVVIDVLSKKSSEQLLARYGKEKLRLELLKEINARLADEDNPVVALYLTDFFVQ